MNTKTIQTTKIKSLPHFPVLSSHKQGKAISKHFTNASVYLPKKEFALLSWLVYQSDSDNSFRYSTQLLRKFSAAIKAINLEYSGESIPTAIQLIRQDLKALIEKGFIIPVGKYHYINPMLFKCKRETAEKYQECTVDNIISLF